MGPENRFIQRVHKKLDKSVYREKMHNVYRGGTPDVWYSGPGGDLWVEYKWIDSVPKSGTIVPNLSALQLDWLTKRYAEGRNVLVVVGTPEGAAVISRPDEWKNGYGGDGVFDDKQLAAYIAGRCT